MLQNSHFQRPLKLPIDEEEEQRDGEDGSDGRCHQPQFDVRGFVRAAAAAAAAARHFVGVEVGAAVRVDVVKADPLAALKCRRKVRYQNFMVLEGER